MLKKIVRAALALLALYAAWLAYSELSFRHYENPGGAAAAPGPGDGVTRELQGVYHIHTTFSDGHATVDVVAARAARERLDFVVLTDHGNPNTASLRAAGRRKGVLVLAGSELNVNRGHLVALGFRPPPGDGKFPSKAEDAVDAVRALGGFTVIAHPYSKVRWSWGDWGESSDYSGIEIVNADTMFKDNYRRVIAYAPLLLLGSRLPLIKMLEHPASNLKRWDQRGASTAIFGYFSADAHLYYRGIFALLRLHVLLDGPAGGAGAEEAGIWDALRHGRFYNAVEAARTRADSGSRRRQARAKAPEAGPGPRARTGWATRSSRRAGRRALSASRHGHLSPSGKRSGSSATAVSSPRLARIPSARRPTARACTGSRSTSRSAPLSGRTSHGSSPTPST